MSTVQWLGIWCFPEGKLHLLAELFVFPLLLVKLLFWDQCTIFSPSLYELPQGWVWSIFCYCWPRFEREVSCAARTVLFFPIQPIKNFWSTVTKGILCCVFTLGPLFPTLTPTTSGWSVFLGQIVHCVFSQQECLGSLVCFSSVWQVSVLWCHLLGWDTSLLSHLKKGSICYIQWTGVTVNCLRALREVNLKAKYLVL